MLFNSLHFLLFFSFVSIAYFAVPQRLRWVLLLSGSYYFYLCWKVEYVLLILFSTAVTYTTGLMIGRARDRARKKRWMYVSVGANLAVLFTFKYFNFVNESLRAVCEAVSISYSVPALKVLLPVGISFYTFQALSYTIDVYRGNKQPETHFGIFALYVSFFPQLVAGPIERSTRLLPQFFVKHDFNYERMASGLRLMLWGYFKKLVIADRLAVYVDAVYSNPAPYNAGTYLVAAFFFAFQIYCDFSGYSDIAVGAARVMGYDLMLNFRRPFFAKSAREFWQRWHISLSSWFMDYLYTPLMLKLLYNPLFKKSRQRANYAAATAILVTFVLCGLWHGARWTMVLYGLLHGVALAVETLTARQRAQVQKVVGAALYNPCAMIATFCFFCLSGVFFRAEAIVDALHIIGTILGNFHYTGLLIEVVNAYEFAVGVFGIALLLAVDVLQERGGFERLCERAPLVLRWSTDYALFFAIIVFGEMNRTAFIYFQF